LISPIQGYTTLHLEKWVTSMLIKTMKGLGLLFCLVFIAGCPQTPDNGQTEELQSKKRGEAAQYNTQLGIGYLKQGDHPRAKRKFLTALRLAPDSPEVNAAMGYFLEQTKDMDDAKAYYKRALSLAPRSGSQKNNYGTFLCRIGQYPEAMKLLIEAGQDVHYEHSGMAYENAGLCAEMMHDKEKSMAYFAKALAQDRHRVVALYEYAKISLADHEPKKALDMLQQYAAATMSDATLVTLGIEAARNLNNEEIAAVYQKRLTALNTGGNHEHDRISA
jgi:type IV pilus assembly protein PilF